MNSLGPIPMLTRLENQLNVLLSNPYILGLCKVVIIFYICLVTPKLPLEMIAFFDNPIVKVCCLFLIFYSSTLDPQLSLMLAIGFIVTIVVVNKCKIESVLENYIGGEEHNSNNSENEVLENQDNSVVPNDADLNGANIDEDDDELLYDGCFPQVSSEENVISNNSAEY